MLEFLGEQGFRHLPSAGLMHSNRPAKLAE
jgi:hypothetical protein